MFITLVPRSQRAPRFYGDVKREIVKNGGDYCLFTQLSFKQIAALEDIALEEAGQCHHIKPRYAGGKSVVENGIYISKNAHIDLHNFIDMFATVHMNYKFLTTVYVNLFLPNPSTEIKQEFDYRLYKDSLLELAKMFWWYIEENTNDLVKGLFSDYMKYWAKHVVKDKGIKSFLLRKFEFKRKSYVHAFEHLRTRDEYNIFLKKYSKLVYKQEESAA